ncbi:outer membrane beta-barrel protein [Leptospira sp. GIMC2001]|uniref:outer membrane beta-barrel protein n=1 Tax=Leptospira sp. GIMC2001 TaxID=1513297 RepID=UPI00234992A4|nr:outer membrane beta-barrel protein [Leptospira sp. GIMC2001]WCL48767.1 outer membrane beta-barrel protein [Leptospira sp. GIMC2001]
MKHTIRILNSPNAKYRFFAFISIIILAFTSQLIGEETSGEKEILLNPDIKIMVDSYYAVTNNRYPNRERPYITQGLNQDEFSVNHALVNIQKESQKFRYALGVHTGSYVQKNYSEEPENMQYIYQGWGGFKLTDGLWLDAGIFPSHIGGESTISLENFNYTRSLVAENSPYYESGARLVWDMTDDLQLSFYVLNGWQRIKDNNRDKAAGIQFQYKITENWTFNYSNFIGNEESDSAVRKTRYFQDVYLKGSIFPWWDLYMIYDIGYQKEQKVDWVTRLDSPTQWLESGKTKGYNQWQGFAIQFYFHLSDQWKIGMRGEGFYDQYNIVTITNTPDGYNVEAGSINIDYLPVENAKLRLECTQKVANNRIYETENHKWTRVENLLIVSLAFML